MIKYRIERIIDVQDWDKLVTETYGKIYSFQQQDGCKDRGMYNVSTNKYLEDFENEELVEDINKDEMGVSFKDWLERDVNKPFKNQKYNWELEMFWRRNFYPDVNMIANDLCKKGLIEEGDYLIDVDW